MTAHKGTGTLQLWPQPPVTQWTITDDCCSCRPRAASFVGQWGTYVQLLALLQHNCIWAYNTHNYQTIATDSLTCTSSIARRIHHTSF